MDAHARSWFLRRTTARGEWDRDRLLERKAGQHISVILPARNEEATVGQIVERLRTELVDGTPLIDELIVIDSDSWDHTASVAASAGAQVVQQDEILPHLPNRPGKGEALWKSLHVSHGDLIAFIDADLEDFDPQFAVGLLGPLLTDPTVDFVKAFYDRPLGRGQTLMPAGGGRVTEILARPLLNVHWPELAGVIQPLAGEYAARRTLLERIPFVSGYGVEIAMLIDVLELGGLDSMAQVDLGTRVHRNSPDDALGRMAAQVYLAMLSRVERHGYGVLATDPSTALTQFTRDGDTFVPSTSDIGIIERPPMIEVADYRNRTLERLV